MGNGEKGKPGNIPGFLFDTTGTFLSYRIKKYAPLWMPYFPVEKITVQGDHWDLLFKSGIQIEMKG